MHVPGVRMVDAADGVLGIEWIEGKSVRHLLPGGAEAERDISEQVIENEGDVQSDDPADSLKEYEIFVGGDHSACSKNSP